KYGESVTAIENPTKVGHTFAGWSKEIPETMPANDITVEAIWTVNSYKLTFDVDGNLTEKTFKYGEFVTAIENPTKVGHTFAGWSEELPETMPANDITVEATWTVNSYKITFDVDGNLTEKIFKYGESVTAIENPTKVGHTFTGWSEELPETMPANDITVEATWTVNSYDITYDFAGGEFKNVDYLNTPLHKFAITDYLTYQAGTGAEIALMKTTPGIYWVYILLKNTNNDGLYEIVQIANGNANVTAEYDYVIAWHDGLTDTSAKSILQKMLASSSSYIGGYVKLSNVPSNKTADCNITAEVYKASDIVINDPLKTSYTIEDSVELPTPSKTGYVFDGWYVNGTKLENIALGSTGNLVLKAQWKVMVYNISLNPDGGKAKYATWDEFVADFLKDFCTYVWNNPTKITSAADFWGSSYSPDTTVQAKIISFFTDNAEKWGFLSDELDAGVKKANWTKYDKTHYYYYRCNLTEYLTKTKRTEWPESCGAFDGMSDPAWVGYYELNYTVDDNIMLPQLYKEGYTFLGWFNGDNKVDIIKAGTTGNLNLVAKWEKIKVYHDLNLDLDGGTLDEVPTQYLEGEEFILPIPTKEGYTFLGWYNGSEKVEKISATETSDISLVAKWKITTDHEGTEVDPYSVDDALKVAGTLTKGNSAADKYYIKGIVSEITELSTSYGNATFKITVDGKTILVFRAKNEGNQNFTSTDDLYVGDEVVIYGNITNYNGTLEITNCYVVSNNKVARPEPIEEPEVVDKTLQEIIDMDDATNKETSYKITVIVLGWGKSLTSYDAASNKYGNMIVSDLEGLNKIVVFGATATISALVWDSTNGKYTYTNKQDFLTNAITKSINIGDTLELIVIRDSYNGSTQLNAIVTKVTPKPVVTSNIVFDLDGGICDNLPTTYEEGKELVLPMPTKDGYDFLGWEYNGTVITVIAPTMTGDLALKAKWQEEDTTKAYFKKVTDVSELTEDAMYLIVYESGEKAFAFDSSLTSKLDVAKNYKEFDITSLGILVNEESKSVIFKIAKNTDGSYAILASNGNYIYHTGTKNTLSEEKKVNNSKHTITFDANGNVILKMSSADYSVRFNSADSDMRFRYYKSGQQSISLYKYSTSTSEPSTSHKINYANLPEGTTNSNPTSYTEGETITLVDPVLAGYTFDGWFDNAECTGTKITEISGYTTDITLYAKFAKIPTHSISYKYNVDSTDITNDNPTEYAEGDSTVLKDAKLTNYAFTGWYLDSEYTNKITAIDHSWTADVVIYGKFILDTLTETIVATASFSANTNSGKVNNYTNTWSVTCDNVTWTMKNFNNNNNGWPYVRAGSKNNASVAEIITDSTMVDAITKVVVTVDKVTASSVNSFKLIVASDANFEKV
ncbi:MAG: InlB B-repeat-containing protein, partial [Bacilli bacterium]|nr:InlB B-repeat-containing protein [Bacilli bacterium]